MNTYVYGDDGKALIRLDPRTKLFIFLISGTVSLKCCARACFSGICYGRTWRLSNEID